MKNILLCIFFLILSTEIIDAAILSHNIDMEIDPQRHLINATDTMKFNKDNDNERFFLNKDIRIISIKSGDTPLEYSKSIKGEYQEIIVNLTNRLEVTIAYEGIIYDELKKAGDLTFVKGDKTKGIISEGGVFLAPETGWYPDDEGLSIFHIKARIKGGLRTVTQGEVVKREYRNDTEYSEWKGSVPVDGLFLVASRFVIDEVDEGKIRFFTYLSKENAHLSKIFIEGSKRYIEFYSKILGDYPYRDWSIVENFFSSGYGMPGFTLLDPLVIRQGERILRPGYIDHEIVHSWFGNYVYPDYKKGNWVEAITTYLSNYYYKEVFSGEEETKRHRISTVERFSIRVTPERDYPLRNFISKEEDYDNDIGYGKGSMVFHSLRRIIGDRAFFSSLKTIVSRYGGRRASWEDLRRVFEESYGSDLSFFFEQWLDRKGGPVISLKDLSLEAGDKGYLIKGKILQEGDPYKLSLPLVITTEKGKKEIIINVKEVQRDFDIPVDDKPIAIEIDPDYHVFSIVHYEDLNPSLNLFLSRKMRYYVLTQERFRKYFEEITERLMMKGGEIISRERLNEYLDKGSIFIMGNPPQGLLNDLLKIKEEGFDFKGKAFNGSIYSILLSIRNPYNKKEVIVFYYGNSPEALERARYIPYYGTDTYVIFRNGQPLERGYLDNETSRTRYLFGYIDTNRLKGHIGFLADPRQEGRLPGSSGDRNVRDYLMERLKEYGFNVQEQIFIINESEFDKKRLKAKVTFPVSTGNVFGIKEGKTKKYIVLSAHHDHHGVSKEGEVYCGADDNASGVAAVLEIARNLGNHTLKKGLIVLFPGAEEWGLIGSRYFIKNFPLGDRSLITEVINIDSIGRSGKEVFLIGSSFYPELADVIKRHLSKGNLREGRDIDRYAFKEGSDHYSFHEAGIPCIDIFSSDYKKIDRPGDDREDIDYKKIREIGRLIYQSIFDLLSAE